MQDGRGGPASTWGCGSGLLGGLLGGAWRRQAACGGWQRQRGGGARSSGATPGLFVDRGCVATVWARSLTSITFVPFSPEISGVWGPSASGFFQRSLKEKHMDRDLDLYHWSSTTFCKRRIGTRNHVRLERAVAHQCINTITAVLRYHTRCSSSFARGAHSTRW